MAYKEFDMDEIDTSVVYLSKTEVFERIGITRATLYNHTVKDHIDAVRFHNRTFFHPNEIERCATLIKCGFLKGDPGNAHGTATNDS